MASDPRKSPLRQLDGRPMSGGLASPLPPPTGAPPPPPPADGTTPGAPQPPGLERGSSTPLVRGNWGVKPSTSTRSPAATPKEPSSPAGSGLSQSQPGNVVKTPSGGNLSGSGVLPAKKTFPTTPPPPAPDSTLPTSHSDPVRSPSPNPLAIKSSPVLTPDRPQSQTMSSASAPVLNEKFLRSPSDGAFLSAPTPTPTSTMTGFKMPEKALPPPPARKESQEPPRPPGGDPPLPLPSTPEQRPLSVATDPGRSGSIRQLPTDEPDTESTCLWDGRLMKAGTPAKILEKMATPGVEQSIILDGILTYPLFSRSDELLDSLVTRFQNVSSSAVRRRILCEVIKTWIEYNFDWAVEPKLRNWLNTVRLAKTPESTIIPELLALLDRITQRNRDGYAVISAPVPDAKPQKPMLPKDPSKMQTIEDIHPKEMARQITLLAYDIYRKIKVSELLKQAWSKKDKEKNAPNVLQLINRFNRTALWVASMCVLPDSVQGRANTISYFIKVAKEMRELRNFDGMVAIINGLENSSVRRLKQSWALVPELTQMKELMTFDGNYKAYREHLAGLDTFEPAVPFIAPFLGDLTFIDENPNQINGLVNFGKMRMISRSLQVALKFQRLEYSFEPVQIIQRYLSKIPLPEEKDIYEVSIKREAKNAEDTTFAVAIGTVFY